MNERHEIEFGTVEEQYGAMYSAALFGYIIGENRNKEIRL